MEQAMELDDLMLPIGILGQVSQLYFAHNMTDFLSISS